MQIKRKIYIALLGLFGSIQLLSSQFGNEAYAIRQGYELLPQEGIYIHQNNTLLFSGERLYYKVYCLNLDTKALSDLSKIAYVAMVSKEQQIVFKHKIKLKEGTGNGDFAIPAEVPTGSYKLIAFTSWMQSRAERQYFESDLIIVNPYKVTPEIHQVDKIADSTLTDSLPYISQQPLSLPVQAEPIGESLISLSMNTQRSSTRSAVEVEIQALQADALNGDYSLSVKKVDDSLPGLISTPIDTWKEFKQTDRSRATGSTILPELRGELISGRVVEKESGQAVEGKKVVLSLPGDAYILDIAQSGQSGDFYFNLDTPVNSSQAILQLLEKDRDQYSINLKGQDMPDLKSLEFPSFKLDKSLEEEILRRSVRNQIENSYAIVKSDSIQAEVENIPFYRNYQQRFFLDDYTRFNTLRETMVEIIDQAWIDENNGNPIFGVRPLDGYLDVGALGPIVTIDGLFVQDHKDVVDYNSKELRRIFVSRDRYMVGPQVFQGLVALETKSGDFYEAFYRDFLINNTISRPEVPRVYFFQSHENTSENQRIPDFRYQLFWEPRLEVGDTQKKLTFYTSDIKGEFEVELKGFTNRGVPVSLKQRLSVE